MLIRPYGATDASSTLEVFLRAIHETARRDYTPDQIDAWARDDRDLRQWNEARESSRTQVAEIGGQVCGFVDVASDGHIDMLFVDPDHAREGVATALLDWAISTARRAGATRLTTHASITARRFFSARGFSTDEERHPEIRGVRMTNYLMSYPLHRTGDRGGELSSQK